MSDDIKRTTDVKTDREKVLGIVLGYSSFLFRRVSDVIDCVVELGRVVVDVQYVYDDCSGVGMFVVEYPVRQLVTLS